MGFHQRVTACAYDDEDTLSADKSEEGTAGSFSRLTHAAEALASQVWFPVYCGVLLEVGRCVLFWGVINGWEAVTKPVNLRGDVLGH